MADEVGFRQHPAGAAGPRRRVRRGDHGAAAAERRCVPELSQSASARDARRKKRLDGSYPDNVLASLPYYSPHLTRTVITNTLGRISSVPKSGISAMLAHAGDKADDRLSRTTREFYRTNQRMAEKADAMSAWRDALLNAYVKTGGKPPRTSRSEIPSNRT